jgi:FMN phosphatase YigB (HAD superfamily)
MGVCVGSDRIAVRRRVCKPLELLQQLRNPRLPLAGLLLDLCGVLYDDSAWRRWLYRLVGHMGLHTQYTPFFRLWRREYLEGVKQGRWEYWQALRSYLHSVGMTEGQIDEVEAAGRARREAFEVDIHPLPGVIHTLTYLSERDIPMVLVCSGCLTGGAVQRRLTRLGLGNLFQATVAAADLCTQGADADCFQAAITTSGCHPQQLAYVGADGAALARAAELGLRTVAFNYDDDAVADLYLERFDGLPEIFAVETMRRAAG